MTLGAAAAAVPQMAMAENMDLDVGGLTASNFSQTTGFFWI